MEGDNGACPACLERDAPIGRSYSLEVAARHFVSPRRDPVRHEQMKGLLLDLWGGRETVELRRCGRCGFSFAHPLIAGDARFYNLLTGEQPQYPRRRWEFDRTIESLLEEYAHEQGEAPLLEVGAGSGAFLRRLRRSAVGERFSITAAEYDAGALQALAAAGFRTHFGSLQDLAGDPAAHGRFAVICLFQTLEHLDDIEGVFGALRRLLGDQGHVFLSVPNGPQLDVQEEVSGCLDPPPHHVGRWTPDAFHHVARRHGLRVSEHALEPLIRTREAWRLAKFTLEGRADSQRALASYLVGLRARPLRGPLKRAASLGYLPHTARSWRRFHPAVLWVHLQPTDRGSSGSP